MTKARSRRRVLTQGEVLEPGGTVAETFQRDCSRAGGVIRRRGMVRGQQVPDNLRLVLSLRDVGLGRVLCQRRHCDPNQRPPRNALRNCRVSLGLKQRFPAHQGGVHHGAVCCCVGHHLRSVVELHPPGHQLLPPSADGHDVVVRLIADGLRAGSLFCSRSGAGSLGFRRSGRRDFR